MYETFISALVTGGGAVILVSAGLWVRGKIVGLFKKEPPAC